MVIGRYQGIEIYTRYRYRYRSLTFGIGHGIGIGIGNEEMGVT